MHVPQNYPWMYVECISMDQQTGHLQVHQRIEQHKQMHTKQGTEIKPRKVGGLNDNYFLANCFASRSVRPVDLGKILFLLEGLPRTSAIPTGEVLVHTPPHNILQCILW